MSVIITYIFIFIILLSCIIISIAIVINLFATKNNKRNKYYLKKAKKHYNLLNKYIKRELKK